VTRLLNASALPAGSFTGCKPGSGGSSGARTEVIRAPRRAGRDSWIAMDIVGALNFVQGVVAIDDHDMWVYAVDGSYVRPQRVHAVRVASAERYSVLVRLRRGGRFKVRCHASSSPQMIVGHAILSVPGGGHGAEDGETGDGDAEQPREGAESVHRQWMDLTGRPLSADVVLFDPARAHPFPAEHMAGTADALHVLDMRFLDPPEHVWALNTTDLRPAALERLDPPLLLDGRVRDGGTPPGTVPGDVAFATRNGTWVDLVFRASGHAMPAHPIHKHGVKMFVLGSGRGPFGWASVEHAARERPGQFNLVDPPRRDGVLSLPVETGQESWVAVRYQVSSPGAWLVHCHIGTHMMGGMMM
ncbi:hypothetical protein E4U53_005000, partial [Claviceps sorghi]